MDEITNDDYECQTKYWQMGFDHCISGGCPGDNPFRRADRIKEWDEGFEAADEMLMAG